MLNGLDLFSGIGGITLALKGYVEPVAYCERNLFAISVLLERMRSQEIPCGPICTDVSVLRGSNFGSGQIDIIYGGFPCQDLSVAGNREGLSGKRSGLFWQIIRLTKEIQPPFVFLENVGKGSETWVPEVRLAFRQIDYRIKDTQIEAWDVGAPTERKRWFCLAYPMRIRHWYKSQSRRIARACGEDTANTRIYREELELMRSKGLEGRPKSEDAWEALRHHRCSSPQEWPSWLPKPSLPRGHDGLQFRVERIKSTGNAVVPLQARTAFEMLIGKEYLEQVKKEMR